MLQPLQPHYLSQVWHMIKPGIEEMLAELNKEAVQEFWIPEDVYSSIKSGQSVLWVGDEGFVVTQIRFDMFTGAKQLFIWLGYSYEHDKDIVTSNTEMLAEYGKANGCVMVQFQSTRAGWLRRGKELGFVRGPVTFTKRI